MHWPDAFQGIYTGPALIVGGLVWVVVCTMRPAASPAPPRLRLHSALTYWVKYGHPGLMLVVLLAAAWLTASGGLPADAAGPVLAFLAVLLAASIGLGAQLQLAYSIGDKLYLGRYLADQAYPVDVLQQQEPLLANLYRLRTTDGRSRFVLMRLTKSRPWAVG
ncbi:hypothetical protein [Hymenobacter sp. CRA2]|uniref:hypothetical protein n=1 Tax=Hymenobacter sp. CRA2 TaxID=1955620 RepID=UPI001116E3A3|nr:hypothetical protein [Hymenobacter sp. CRA2]